MSNYLYCHYSVGENSTSINQTLKITIDFDHTLEKLLVEVENAINSSTQSIVYKALLLSKNQNFKELKGDLPIKYLFNNGDDIFSKCRVETHKPVESTVPKVNPETNKISAKKVEEKPKEGMSLNSNSIVDKDDLTYKVISNYSFSDDNNKFAKVYLTFKGAEKIDRDTQLEVEFKESSFVIRIKGFGGFNYRYGVTRLHNKIDPEQCRVIIKKDQIIIKLKKLKEGDVWSFLHKTQMVGDN